MIKWIRNKAAERQLSQVESLTDFQLQDLIDKKFTFDANGNVWNVEQIDELFYTVKKLQAEFHVAQALEACMINLDDANLVDTPKRIVKMWMGDSFTCDTELGGGRFARPVRLPKFPNEKGTTGWVSKTVNVLSVCSHHFMPFYGEATISYKPDKFLLGISKLQRLTYWLSQRFWLQEDLTVELKRVISEAAEVPLDHVKVNIVASHGCEQFRGVRNYDSKLFTDS